jgi:hypothetical protein
MLPNGQVLITGGASTSGQFFASAELYDPSAGKFTAIASMTVPRSNHTATLLPNGLVLIAGGRGNRSFGQTAELYDPGVGTFTVTVNMVEEKSYHTATVLPNGKVLIAGGDYFVGGLGAAASGTTAAAELYDPEAGTFAATGSMAAHRQHHTATLLPNGKVLIVGFHWSAELYELGGTTTTGGTISTGGVPAAGGATGTSAMTLAEACAKNCALASGLPGCSTTTTECEQNCMTTYDNTSAVNLDLGRQYTAMMICIATNLTSAYDYVCAKPNRPLNKWSPGPYTTCEDLICSWNCDDATLGNFDPWVDIRCAPCGGP